MLLFTFNSSEKMRSFLLSIHILDFFPQKVMNSEIELGVGMREGYLWLYEKVFLFFFFLLVLFRVTAFPILLLVECVPVQRFNMKIWLLQSILKITNTKILFFFLILTYYPRIHSAGMIWWFLQYWEALFHATFCSAIFNMWLLPIAQNGYSSSCHHFHIVASRRNKRGKQRSFPFL